MVSIIIPTYNYGLFIEETIKSVLEQTYEDFECIIIDNGSKDNTPEIVKPYLVDKRIQYHYLEISNVSFARNFALKKAQGEFILFLDADDLIEKDKLNESVKFLIDNPNISLVYGDMRYFKDGNKEELFYNYDLSSHQPWMSYVSGSGKFLLDKILDGNFMVISSPIFRLEIVNMNELFDESIMYNEDWDFWMRLLLNNNTFEFKNFYNAKTLIRIHASSVSKDVFKMQMCGLMVLLKNRIKIISFGLENKFNQKIMAHKRMLLSTLSRSTPSLFHERIELLKEKHLFSEVITVKYRNETLLQLYVKILNLYNNICQKIF